MLVKFCITIQILIIDRIYVIHVHKTTKDLEKEAVTSTYILRMNDND